MLKLEVMLSESFNEADNEFVEEFDELELEHSLVSLSKWEAFFEKSFLSSENKTVEETFEYVRMMNLHGEISPEVFSNLTTEHLDKINTYILSKQSATTFKEPPGPQTKEIITSEVIYSWMVSLNIPFECQHWHLSRLLNLIKVCSLKNVPPKKMSRQEVMRHNREENARRKRELGTKG